MEIFKNQKRGILSAVFAAVFLALAALSLALASASASAQEEAPQPPEVEAAAWVLADADSGRVLAGQNGEEELPVASIAKVMTALVVLDSGVSLDREVMVSENAASYAQPPYSNVGLRPGERASVRELLRAALIPSGIDAVYALAEGVGEGGVEGFVERMNQKASDLGLENTNFADPAGLDPETTSSARDLVTLSRAALEYEFFANTVDTSEGEITASDREIPLITTNQLLVDYASATGIKTGTTPQSGPSLVASAERDGESYIAVVLDAEERFSATTSLLEYGFQSYEQRPVIEQNRTYEEVTPPFRRSGNIELRAAEDVGALVGPGAEVERRVEVPEDLPAEAGVGQEIGTVNVFVDGSRVGSTPLVASEGYDEVSFLGKSWYRIREFVGGIV